jgi:hypothetical protein
MVEVWGNGEEFQSDGEQIENEKENSTSRINPNPQKEFRKDLQSEDLKLATILFLMSV